MSIFQLIPSHTQNRQILTLEEMSKNAILYNPRTLLGGATISIPIRHTLSPHKTLNPSIPTTKGATPICYRKGRNYFSNIQHFQTKKLNPYSLPYYTITYHKYTIKQSQQSHKNTHAPSFTIQLFFVTLHSQNKSNSSYPTN